MNHTPGPWEVAELIPDGLFIKTAGTYEIRTNDYDVATNVPFGGPFRKLADAQLASAAPNLLTACKAAENWISETISLVLDPETRRPYSEDIEMLMYLRAAIAAAETEP